MQFSASKFLSVATLILITSLASGCSTMATAARGEGSGSKATYSASFETIWNAIPAVISDTGLEIVSTNKSDRTILAQRGITAFSWGENVAIFVRSLAISRTQVEVVSKRTATGNFLAPDWESPILNALSKRFNREE